MTGIQISHNSETETLRCYTEQQQNIKVKRGGLVGNYGISNSMTSEIIYSV